MDTAVRGVLLLGTGARTEPGPDLSQQNLISSPHVSLSVLPDKYLSFAAATHESNAPISHTFSACEAAGCASPAIAIATAVAGKATTDIGLPHVADAFGVYVFDGFTVRSFCLVGWCSGRGRGTDSPWVSGFRHC